MTRPERQQAVLGILQDFRGPEPLKQLFWSELNYSRVNTPLSRGKWNATAAESLGADPVLFATGGDGFHIIHSRLPTDKLLMGQERPVVSQLLKEHPYALFVFSNKSLSRWHFLNVKYDDEVTKRRVFRRITIGPGERLRTASERIAKLDLESVGAGLFGLSPLEIQAQHDKAFDKEPLTKDFFKRFDQVLEAIKSDLEEYQRPVITSAEAYTQAQLLLERLIFLYFLQNRGWLNQDDRFLLNHLTEHQPEPGAFTYYSEFLDKLFWTLSSAPGEGGRMQGIPFLNGGLFDDDEFRQPAGSRKTNPPLKVRNSTFKSVFGGLLEAFNFTVTEDTPLNQEVAVDPEMLGKVFESIVLHAEAADPDATAPDKRKATGSYYTPRIVVHFICREVLYQYFHARLECGDSSPLSDAATRRGVKPTADESAAGKSGNEFPHSISPLDQAQRPFRLWQQVEGDYNKAAALIPASWPVERKSLWKARLAAIRDNEHIRRIEQPVYKRRWDEQWKVGNEWRSGPVAYAAEFVNAFEWWLSEKAEWWLEHKKNGGPVELDDWAEAIWKDSRVQAAWPVAAENYALLEYGKAKAKAEENGEAIPTPPAGHGGDLFGNTAAFLRTFKRIIDDETVPEDIPFAVPYDDLERRKIKISPKIKSIRGKLNVPRERFHLRGRTTYLWAGL
jgi:hypothetical protein